MSSQWRAQLGALGLDEGAKDESGAKRERLLMDAVALPELMLPQPVMRRNRKSWGIASMMIAASAAFVFFPSAPKQDLTVKGFAPTTAYATVSVFWERDGSVHPLQEGDALVAGDRVRASVKSEAPGLAYWLVTDRQGRPLMDRMFVADNALPLTANLRTAFARSLRLDAAIDGEKLVIATCVDAAPRPKADDAVLAALFEGKALPSACVTATTKLRD